MAIRKKPEGLEELKINSIIERGGSSSSQPSNSIQFHRLTLRIPLPLKQEIDRIISTDPTCPSLTTWILEAIKRRVQKE